MRSTVLPLTGAGAGRTLLMGQIFARPWRIPAADARSTLEDFWAAPAFSAALAAFDGYMFRDGHELRHVPVTRGTGAAATGCCSSAGRRRGRAGRSPMRAT